MTQTHQPPKADFGNGHPFTGADIVHAFSRADALEQGVLLDVTEHARAYGFRPGVAITAAVFATFIKPGLDAMREAEAADTMAKRMADLLFAVRVRIYVLEDNGSTDRVWLDYYTPADERVRIWCRCGPGDNAEPVITIMLATED